MDAVRAVLEKEKALRSDEDALVLAVHATLELDGVALFLSSARALLVLLFAPLRQTQRNDRSHVVVCCDMVKKFSPLRFIFCMSQVADRALSLARTLCVCSFLFVFFRIRSTTGLRCIASSEAGAKSSKFEPHAISGPLPVDWNESEDMYCLYYRHAAYPGALFTVKCIVMDDMLIVHAASDQAPGNERSIFIS